MTPAQCRAARAILGKSQQEIADAAGVGIQTLIAFESARRQPYAKTLDAIRQALEAQGVLFIAENGEGAGVRLRKDRSMA